MMGVGIDDWEMGTRALLCGIELTWGLSVVRDSSRRYKRDGERGKEKEGERGEGSRNEERENVNRPCGFKVQSSKTYCSVNNIVFWTWGMFS